MFRSLIFPHKLFVKGQRETLEVFPQGLVFGF